jgi:polyhydroxyalkanoate synthesis regulator phasin
MAKRDLSDVPYLLVGSAVAIQEEVEKAMDRLVDKGKSLTPEGRKMAAGAKKGLVSKGDEFSQVVGRTVQRVLENAGLVTKADLEDMEGRVTDMEKRVMARKKTAKKKAARKPAKKKPAKKKSSRKKASGKKKSSSKKASGGKSSG